MKKNILICILILSAIALNVSAQEPGITYLDEPYANINLAFSQSTHPPVPIPLENITDSLSDYVVGHSAIHQVGFQLPYFEGTPTGLLRGRQVVITFPPEFDVRAITSVSYFDTDDADDPRIDWIFVYAHSLVVRFKDKIPGPIYPNYAYLKINTLDNPTVVDNYRVIVQIDNLLAQTIAGPGFSDRFTIIAGEAQSLSITPSGDTTLHAGEGIEFKASAVDEYGNPIETGRIRWSLDPDLENIGRFYGSFLQATTVGQGRVIARVDDFEARSGLITVIPGEFAAIGISLDESQFTGIPFVGAQSAVMVYDEYGNLIEDFNQSGRVLTLSVDHGLIDPETIPAGHFVGGVAKLSEFTYSGDPGQVMLTVSDGHDIEASAEFYANGISASFNRGNYPPEWTYKDWGFSIRGDLLNPGNLTPISLSFDGEFTSGDASPGSASHLRDCLPQPFGGPGCRFSITQLADLTPGLYDYKITVLAQYELAEFDTITVEWSFIQAIRVDDFTPFSFQPVDLADTIYSLDHEDTAQVRLINENPVGAPVTINAGLMIESGDYSRFLGGTPYLDFGWEPETLLDLYLRIYSGIPAGLYDYVIDLSASYISDDSLWRISYRAQVPLDAQVQVIMPELMAIQLHSVYSQAINAPFVNTGQEFKIAAEISNLNSFGLYGPFTLEISGDGQSITPAPVVLDYIPVTDTPFIITFPVTAGSQPNPAEIFTVRITDAPDSIEVLPAIDNYAAAVIQTPANIKLIAEILHHPGPVSVLGFGQPFDIRAAYINSGESSIENGTLILDYGGPGDFGLSFPDEEVLDTAVYWSLTAPDLALSSAFNVAFGEPPVDRNTGQPAIVSDTSINLDFEIIPANTRLIMDAGSFSTRPLERGVAGSLFRLIMQNTTSDYRNTLSLQRIHIQMLDRDNKSINPGDVLDSLSGLATNFYLNDIAVGTPDYSLDGIDYNFSNVTVRPGEVITIEFRLQPKADAKLDYFNIRLDGSMIRAVISEGPQAGQMVTVVGLLDRAFEINIPQAIIPEEFAASFKNYPNPFNPMLGPTEIRYNLPYDSDVDIHIYTVTGEEVRHMHFAAGGNGGQSGLNAGIYWDGRNGRNDIVMNGIYIAYIKAASGGLTAKVKMAVVK